MGAQHCPPSIGYGAVGHLVEPTNDCYVRNSHHTVRVTGDSGQVYKCVSVVMYVPRVVFVTRGLGCRCRAASTSTLR